MAGNVQIAVGPRGGKIAGWTGRTTRGGRPEPRYVRQETPEAPATAPAADPQEQPQQEWLRTLTRAFGPGWMGPKLEIGAEDARAIHQKAGGAKAQQDFLTAQHFAARLQQIGILDRIGPRQLFGALGDGLQCGSASATLERIGVREADGEIHIDSIATIQDAARGTNVGIITRRISRLRDGRLVVTHLGFEIDEAYQGNGTAKRLLSRAFQAYEKMGVAEIQTYADESVGGYTWAMFGFDFENQQDPERFLWILRKKVRAALSRRTSKGALFPPPSESVEAAMHEIQRRTGGSAPAIARVVVNGVPVGKQALLGNNWNARLVLSGTNPWYAAGREYASGKPAERIVVDRKGA